jgi:hypothetical protein
MGDCPLLRPRYLANLKTATGSGTLRNITLPNARDIDNPALGPFRQPEAIVILRTRKRRLFISPGSRPLFHSLRHQTHYHPAAGITDTPNYYYGY